MICIFFWLLAVNVFDELDVPLDVALSHCLRRLVKSVEWLFQY